VLDAIEGILWRTPESRAVFAPNGRYVREGDVVRQPELAASIELIAERGPAALYSGELARAMVAHQHQNGGRLTMSDLARYRPVWRRPLTAEHNGHSLVTNPPPSSGGVLIAHMLAVLDGTARGIAPGSAPALRVLAETMRQTARRRDREFVRLLHRGGLAAHMLDPAAIAMAQREVRAALAGAPTAMAAVASDRGTTHISVLDGEGNAASFTASNGSHSGVIVPGTGLHLNNMMGEEDLSPLGFFTHPPGRRLPSMMAPTVVRAGGVPQLVLGSAGSNRIRSALLQVIVNAVDLGLDAEAAVRAPRLHDEAGIVYAEPGVDLAALEAVGETVSRFRALNLFFGGCQAVERDPETGALSGGGDPRRGGAVATA
jgi:gamma-glutamyltranspeptidase / glutathione hydrolase